MSDAMLEKLRHLAESGVTPSRGTLRDAAGYIAGLLDRAEQAERETERLRQHSKEQFDELADEMVLRRQAERALADAYERAAKVCDERAKVEQASLSERDLTWARHGARACAIVIRRLRHEAAKER